MTVAEAKQIIEEFIEAKSKLDDQTGHHSEMNVLCSDKFIDALKTAVSVLNERSL